jgi:hypothetical protein
MYTDSDGYLREKGFLQFISGAVIAVGAVLLITGVGTAAGIIQIGAGIGSIVGGEVSEALGGSYALGWAIGGVLGAIGGQFAAPVIEGFLSTSFNLFNCAGFEVLSAVTVSGATIVGSAGIIIGIDIMMMSKDPYISYKEQGMTPGQKEIFRRMIEDYKAGEGRGGKDNLLHKIIDELAQLVKSMFPNK